MKLINSTKKEILKQNIIYIVSNSNMSVKQKIYSLVNNLNLSYQKARKIVHTYECNSINYSNKYKRNAKSYNNNKYR